MKCSSQHRLIALYVGGDLDPRRARRLEQHLESCATCRGLAEELQADREALAGLDSEASESLGLGSIRGAVLAEIEGRRRSTFWILPGRPGLALVAAVAVVLLTIAVVMRPGGSRREPRIAEQPEQFTPPAVDIVDEAVDAVPPPAESVTDDRDDSTISEPVEEQPLRLARAVLPPVAPPGATSPSAAVEPMIMKILTDDPEVVIYWIVDPKGEEKDA